MGTLPLASEFPASDEQAWLGAVEKALKGKPYESLVSSTLDGLEVKPLYGPCHDAKPLVRTARNSGDLPWHIMQRADVPDLARANRQMLDDLNGGASGIALVLPDAATALSHGVPAGSLDDLKRLFEGVELDLIALRLDGARHARVVAPLLLELYGARNLDLSRCNLNLGLDPAASFALTGAIVRRDILIGRMAEMVAMARDRGSKTPVFVADARVYQGAGSSCAQDVALIAASLVETFRLLAGAGHPPAEVAHLLGVVTAAGADQFPTIAKIRAIRLVWRRICEAMDVAAPDLPIDVETSNRMMTRNDPHVNMLRVTSAVFGAGVGGADSIAVLPFSSALGLPDAFARRMARNVQIILQEESGIGRVEDPVAGSGYAETLSRDLAAAGWKIFQQIEANGGIFAGLADNSIQSSIADMAGKQRQLVSTRRIKITGVSEFATLAETRASVWNITLPDGWAGTRDAGSMDPSDLVSCARLPQSRLSQEFEKLRDAAAHYEARVGGPPCIFLAKLGAPSDFTARATWTQNLFAAGGLASHSDASAQDAGSLVTAFKASQCSQACICSSDAVYDQSAAMAAKALKQAGAKYVWLAGKPGANEHKLRAAGVDGFVHEGVNVLGILQGIYALSGIDRATETPGATANG